MLIAIIFAALYLLFFLWLLSGFDKLINTTSDSVITTQFVSVIISVKNEESNLDSLLHALKNQTISKEKFEIIIVNDKSTDRTLEILNSYKSKLNNLNIINIKDTPPDWSNKKWALSEAINHSKGNIILQTDGDCIPDKGWILNMATPFNDPEVGFAAGFTPLNKHSKSMIDRLLYFESISQDAFNAACIGKQLTISCVGRNIAFKKSYFDKINGYQNMKDVISGDDDLLLHHIVYSNSCKIKYVISNNSYVYSDRPKTINSFISQRLRFASKGKLYYNLPYISNELKLLLPFLYLTNLFVIISLFLFIQNPIIFFIIPYILKSVADFLLLYMFNNDLKIKWDNFSFFILTIIHPFYIILFSSMAPFKKIKWK